MRACVCVCVLSGSDRSLNVPYVFKHQLFFLFFLTSLLFPDFLTDGPS